MSRLLKDELPRVTEWGSWLSVLLAGVGITRTSYRHAKAYCGIGDACGCGQRESKWNQAGEWFAAALATSYSAASGLAVR